MAREGYVSDYTNEEAERIARECAARGCTCSLQQIELVGCECELAPIGAGRPEEGDDVTMAEAIPTFAQLDKEAASIPFSDPVCSGVNHLIAHADDNGKDEAEKMASLQDLLAYTTSPDAEAVRDWFSERNVKW